MQLNLYAIKRNFCVLRKLFRKLDQKAVTEENFPELFVDGLKVLKLSSCADTQDEARYACETLRCDKCTPRNLFVRDASGKCRLEKDFPMSPGQRAELKLPFFEMDTEKVELKTKSANGQAKIWRIKTLKDRLLNFDTWLKLFQEQLEKAWVYYQRFQ